jgi:hypothetical protein
VDSGATREARTTVPAPSKYIAARVLQGAPEPSAGWIEGIQRGGLCRAGGLNETPRLPQIETGCCWVGLGKRRAILKVENWAAINGAKTLTGERRGNILSSFVRFLTWEYWAWLRFSLASVLNM